MPDPIAIVGTGIAGATAALTLRAEGFTGRILLIGDEPLAPYRRPPLSKEVLRGSQAPARTLLRPAGSWSDQGIELLTGTLVTELDPAARKITLQDGTRLPYSKLLLATGGRPRSLASTPGPPGVHHLRTLADAQRLRGALIAGGSVLVVGGGLIGLEVAASARVVGCEVTLVEAASEPLARVLPPAIARAVAALHRAHGVDLRTGVELERFDRLGDSVVALARGGALPAADTVVAAVGMVPATELAEQAGLAVQDGILVDEYCATSDPGIFAAGDAARRPDPFFGGTCRVEHWTHAQEQGTAAAHNMLGVDTPYVPVPWHWTRQYDLDLQVCGHPHEARSMTVSGSLEALDFSAVLRCEDRVVGLVCANRPADFRRFRPLVTGEPQDDLHLPECDSAAVPCVSETA